VGESVDQLYSSKKHIDITSIDDYIIRPSKKQDQKRICEIAKTSFRLSYFYRCGFAKRSEIDRYHKVWVKNVSENKNFLIFVAEKRGIVDGFVAMNMNNTKNSTRMFLMAVDDKCRGKGIGTYFTKKCLKWSVDRKKKTFLRTQSDNEKALSIYRKMGFKVISSEKIFCKKI